MGKEVFEYKEGELTVIWKPALCIHSKRCWHQLPTVFNPSKRPWIDMKGGSAEQIVAQVKQCPSGALSYEISNTEVAETSEVRDTSIETAPGLLQIDCLRNGPLLVHGKILITNSDGKQLEKEGSVALCRCGGSADKPFCDGSHQTNGFCG